MAYAFVNQGSTYSAGAAASRTVVYSPTAGNLIVVGVSADSLDTSSFTVDDSGKGNTFNQISTSITSGNSQINAAYYVENCLGGSTTFRVRYAPTPGTSTARFGGLYVAEYSGIATSGSFLNGARAENNNPGAGAGAISSGVANATSQPALVWGFCVDCSGTSNPTADTGAGFTGHTAVWLVGDLTALGEDRRVTATGNVAATFTAGTGGDDFVSFVGIFLEDSAVLFSQICM